MAERVRGGRPWALLRIVEVGVGDVGLLRHGSDNAVRLDVVGIKPVASTSAAPGGWREAEQSDQRTGATSWQS